MPRRSLELWAPMASACPWDSGLREPGPDAALPREVGSLRLWPWDGPWRRLHLPLPLPAPALWPGPPCAL